MGGVCNGMIKVMEYLPCGSYIEVPLDLQLDESGVEVTPALPRVGKRVYCRYIPPGTHADLKRSQGTFPVEARH